MWHSHHNGALFALRIVAPALLLLAGMLATSGGALAATPKHAKIDCAANAPTCAETWDSEKTFGQDVYVGHDEPSLLFYSDKPGAGNNVRYQIVLPTDPSANNPLMRGKAYGFELHIAPWFGMGMCDTQSYPEQLSTCTPDSDSNITDPALTYKAAGQAYTELQFYPPGWVNWEAGISCDSTKWCAALNIWSLSENPVTGEVLNDTCANRVGVEYGNFAFVTLSGTPQPGSPPNPFDATDQTFTPDPAADLFMDQGDHLNLTMHDTAHGLQVIIDDTTSGQTGSMTASAANGFGQIQFKPNGTQCNMIPYDFHPMFSTNTEKTRLIWGAHGYNVAFSDEIGHFDYCTDINKNFGKCVGKEGVKGDREPADGDDTYCLKAGKSSLVEINGCLNDNTGFDGYSYRPLWPDGNTTLRPTPFRLTSPLTGTNFDHALRPDRIRIRHAADRGRKRVRPLHWCRLHDHPDHGRSGSERLSAACSVLPVLLDDEHGWPVLLAARRPHSGSTNDFGQQAQWGTLLNLTYTDISGFPTTRYNDFRGTLSSEPLLTPG